MKYMNTIASAFNPPRPSLVEWLANAFSPAIFTAVHRENDLTSRNTKVAHEAPNEKT